MITRTYIKGDASSNAVYSDCETYRYALTRIWNADERRILFVMLNPSTATEIQNDPTVERCERRARALGYGGFQVCNIFAFRSTNPQNIRLVNDPIGKENDKIILKGATWAHDTICAWGTHGAYLQRGAKVANLLCHNNIRLYHLGLSKEGHPKHPLYISYAVQPMVWK